MFYGLQILILGAAGLQIRPNEKIRPNEVFFGLQILIHGAAGLQIRPNEKIRPNDSRADGKTAYKTGKNSKKSREMTIF